MGNPASRSHAWGWEAEEAVENARDHVADLIGADPREIVLDQRREDRTTWPSRALPSSTKRKGKHLITVKTEHKAVLDTMRELERQGFEVTYLDVQADGLLDLDERSRPRSVPTPSCVQRDVRQQRNRRDPGHRRHWRICREKGVIFMSTLRRPRARWPST